MAVDFDTAILQLPDSMETKIPVNKDHSQIVKLDHRNTDVYETAVGYLRQFEQDAGKVVSDRFQEIQVRRLSGTVTTRLSCF